MKIELEIDEEELTRLVRDHLVDTITSSTRSSFEKRVIGRAVKETIDKVCLENRDEYYDRVVEKTADKIVRKLLKEQDLISLILKGEKE
ncbi:MAG: hypothetical protein Q4B26_05525 [Eubacteriales bacterium]|nr:hypothetical protein [Eubacteriales bacterium]